MRKNKILLSWEKANQKQVQAAIGRRLKEHCAAPAGPPSLITCGGSEESTSNGAPSE